MEAMREPTDKQMQVVNFIRSYRDQHGYPPSLTDIGTFLGLSKSTVFAHLAACERKGLIEIDRGKQRALRVVESA